MVHARTIGRALALCLCSLGALGCFVDSAAGAIPVVARLHVAFLPDRAGARTTIELSLVLRGTDGGPPPPLRTFALQLPAGMGIATTTLGEANCDPSSLIAAGLGGCSPNAVLGFGSATAVVPVAGSNVREQAVLHPLMGPPRENGLEMLFYVQANAPVFAQLVLPAVVAEDTAPYGEQLVTSVPLVQTWPEGPDLSLQSFSSTIGPLHLVYHRHVGPRSVAFRPQGIRIPSQCPRGGYPFAARLDFIDGTSVTAAYRVACSPR